MFEKSADMRTAKSAGSPAFLPPELCMARHGDISGKAADIWSMGISLYCLKYGRLPFHRDNVLEMYDSIRNEDLAIPPDEDPNLVDLLHRVLQKDPEQRMTMAELRVRMLRFSRSPFQKLTVSGSSLGHQRRRGPSSI
jgi:calcium/calmodulin-dependent protein kinase kinase 2